MGIVYLVGAGPGDSKLITVYGKEILEKADCVIYDRLIGEELLNLIPINCEKIYVGKKNKLHIIPQSKIQELLYEKSKQYNTVVRLKGGDPLVFGRGAEEALYLKEKGVKTEIVPGVTSAIAALTYAGIPITHRGVSKGFRVITAHSEKDIMTNINFKSMTPDDETYVFLMGLHHLEDITKRLLESGKNPNTPCAVISNATTARQKKCISTISSISNEVERQGLTSPATIVVGNVVNLSKKLPCFEKKPLFSKRLLVPYIEGIRFSFSNGLKHETQNELINKLRALGAFVEPYHAGTIEIIEFDKSVATFAETIAFSSTNAVYSFMSQIGDIRNIPNVKIVAVGDKSRSALREFGLTVDYVAKTAEELSQFLKNKNNVLHFCANKNARSICKNSIQIPCYKNVATNEKINNTADFDAAVFTCGSNVQRTVDNAITDLPKNVFSIGKNTTAVLHQNNIQNVLTSDEPTTKSLVEKIISVLH